MIKPKQFFISATLVVIAGVAASLWLKNHFDLAPPLPVRGLSKDHLALAQLPRSDNDLEVDEFNPSLPASQATSSANTPASPQTLLPEEISDTTTLRELADLALKGHPTAACRLYARATQCLSKKARREFAQHLETALTLREPQTTDELMVRAIGQVPSGDYDPANCAGTDVMEVPDADEYLGRSIARMSIRQRVLLVMMRPDGSLVRLPRQPDNTVRTGRSSDYLIPQILADNFQRFLQEGVAASDPIALEGLILLHAPGYLPGASNGLSSAIPDPQKFVRAALLMQVLYGPEALGPAVDAMLDQTLSRMNPALRNRVETEVTARAAIWNPTPSSVLESQALSKGDTEALCVE